MVDTGPAPEQMSDSRRHRDKESSSWIVGIILILLGAAFLLDKAGYMVLAGNWWAIFIYLAAIASLVNAWRTYRPNKELTSSGSTSLIWGLVLTVVATILFFNLSWDMWWPAILVVIGVGMIVGYLLRPRA